MFLPIYEDSELAYGKTHYYGGIRKYQWVAIPLQLRGVVALKDGTAVSVVLGEGDEPKFVINDLLPHLGGEQGKKPLNEAIAGETLNILMGSRPLGDSEDSDRVKLRVLDLLHEKYGICEDDLTSAELEVVPAFNATDIGLDGSLIGAYGHDDRVCSYAALKALLELETPTKTAVCMLADKEEIGSMGVTGMQSAFFDTFMEDLCESQGVALRVCYESAFCLSSDVTAAYDPNFAEVYEKRNDAQVNHGLGLCKYTGARGKGGSSDADAETVAYVRRVMDEAGVVWQIGEMGKIDAGGGGTVQTEKQQCRGDALGKPSAIFRSFLQPLPPSSFPAAPPLPNRRTAPRQRSTACRIQYRARQPSTMTALEYFCIFTRQNCRNFCFGWWTLWSAVPNGIRSRCLKPPRKTAKPFGGGSIRSGQSCRRLCPRRRRRNLSATARSASTNGYGKKP